MLDLYEEENGMEKAFLLSISKISRRQKSQKNFLVIYDVMSCDRSTLMFAFEKDKQCKEPGIGGLEVKAGGVRRDETSVGLRRAQC